MTQSSNEKKLKVIAFGIGTSAEVYLKNYREEFEIIALSDWNEKTHNKQRYGFNIIDPYTFNNYEFDKILVLSYYTKEIIRQLQERCNIPLDLIIAPPKYKIKGEDSLPFKNDETKQFARQLILYFTNLANNNNIVLFLEFGTLLGIIRDGDIIDWDDDIDFSINEEYATKTAQLLLNNKDKLPFSDILKWTASVKKDLHERIWYISLTFSNKVTQKFTPFEIAFGVRKTFNNRSVCMRNRYVSCDIKHFEQYDIINFLGKEVKVPFRHEDYLSHTYGDWKTPKIYTFGAEYGSLDNDFNATYKIEVKKAILF